MNKSMTAASVKMDQKENGMKKIKSAYVDAAVTRLMGQQMKHVN